MRILPGSPSVEASRSNGQGMPSRHIDEIEKTHLGPQPTIVHEKSTEKIKERLTHQIRVPHSNRILHADLPHQQTIHPAKGELYEFYTLRV